MQPPLAPPDRAKVRALTSIYAPKSLRGRRRTPAAATAAAAAMLDNDIKIKPTLSPFHPLPAIGQKLDKPTAKVIVFDLNQSKRPSTIEDLPSVKSVKVHEYLKPLTPLEVHGLTRKNSLEDKPQHLLRENTYDVIEPIFLRAAKVKKRGKLSRREKIDILEKPMEARGEEDSATNEDEGEEEEESPKSRLRAAAADKLSPSETGKLLSLRERRALHVCFADEVGGRLPPPRSPRRSPPPPRQLDELSEIFQSLDMRARHKDKMKKENSWF